MRLPHCLDGKIIYATAGSGKTYICNKYNGVIDTDDLLVENACEMIPGFVCDDNVDPRKNIFRFHRFVRYNRFVLNKLYNRTAKDMQDLADRGFIVLTGTVRLMYMADIVFIQEDCDIIRANFDSDKERHAFEMLDSNPDVYYFDNYLEPHINSLVKYNEI